MNRPWPLYLIALAGSLILAGCGSPDSPQRPGAGGGGGDVAEGGIGGSGSGTASAYGSIWVGGTRHFPVAENATVRLDGEPVAANSINAAGRGLPLGITLEYLLADDANDDLTEGTVVALEAWHEVIGPVTSLSPLSVLGQPVYTTSETLLDNLASAGELQIGDLVAVAGLPNNVGSIRATRLARLDEAPLHWQVLGRVQDLDASQFRLRNQVVSRNGLALEQCNDGLADGQKVILQASPQGSFTGGDTLTTAWRLICQRDGLGLFANRTDLPATLPAAVDGIITGIELAPLRISLNGQRVSLQNLLDVGLATLSDLALGARIEIEGNLDTTSGVITATRIAARDPLIRIQAPLNSLLGNVLSVLGINGLILPGTDTSGVGAGDQVSLLGFTDGSGTLYLLDAVRVGVADSTEISLHGLINAVDTAAGTFSVAGVPFEAASADNLLVETVAGLVSIVESGLCILNPILPLLPCPQPDTSAFLAGLEPGTQATIEHANYNGSLLRHGDVILK